MCGLLSWTLQVEMCSQGVYTRESSDPLPLSSQLFALHKLPKRSVNKYLEYCPCRSSRDRTTTLTTRTKLFFFSVLHVKTSSCTIQVGSAHSDTVKMIVGCRKDELHKAIRRALGLCLLVPCRGMCTSLRPNHSMWRPPSVMWEVPGLLSGGHRIQIGQIMSS